jgi:hypothetical protein
MLEVSQMTTKYMTKTYGNWKEIGSDIRKFDGKTYHLFASDTNKKNLKDIVIKFKKTVYLPSGRVRRGRRSLPIITHYRIVKFKNKYNLYVISR